MTDPSDSDATTTRASLGVWDAISLIVGIVVGVAIFKAPPLVFGLVASPWIGLSLWGLGAALALCGALCYSELATTYPQFGAEYVYLSRAYGRRLGFLFGWMQMSAILTGSVGAMAFVFSDYAAHLWPPLAEAPALPAAAAICGLVGLHLCGLRTGKTVQNLLSAAKVLSLGLLLTVGLLLSPGGESFEPVPEQRTTLSGFGLALVFVLYAYGGWTDSATVTPEVRDHQRNMPRALLFALGFIGLLYVSLNLAYLNVLGFAGLRASQAPAADVIERSLGAGWSSAMSLVVMVSALGAIHGMMFAGCRLLLAIGRDHPFFAGWSLWSPRGVPVRSLLTLAGVSLTLTVLVGTPAGRGGLDATLARLGLSGPDWDSYGGGFGTLVAATAPLFWSFLALSSLSLIVLRFRDPERPRPFRVPGYPLTPLVFFGMAAYMLWSSAAYAGRLTLLLAPLLLVGLVFSFLNDGTRQGDRDR